MYEKTTRKDTDCPGHVWESGVWGVIVGVSTCRRCGRVAELSDFTNPKQNTENVPGSSVGRTTDC